MEKKLGCDSSPSKLKIILAGIDTGEYDINSSMSELCELVKTAASVNGGCEILATVTQKRSAPEPATFLGEGKLDEIRMICESENNENHDNNVSENEERLLIVFDNELSASQIRNIEKITDTRTIDRTMLILDIFANRATSKEGRLCVELAQLRYRLPRLVGMGISMSRLGGGIGTRGPGETKLETDRRHIRRKIEKLSEELKQLETRRSLSRLRRKKDNVLVGAIVGYTNAGKSTLLNALTGANVLAEDKLFATLDTVSRGIPLPDGRELVIVDTVGLIRRLPHHLIKAFKSTLEEAKNADIILHVRDISDDEAYEKAQVATQLLGELGASGIPLVNVLNKCDKVEGGDISLPLMESDNTVKISAKKGEGFELLLRCVAKNLPSLSKRAELLFPFDKVGLIAKIRVNGKIFKEEYRDDGVYVDALIEKRLVNEMDLYSL